MELDEALKLLNKTGFICENTSDLEAKTVEFLKAKIPSSKIVDIFTLGNKKNPEKIYVKLHDEKTDTNWKFVLEFKEGLFELTVGDRTKWFDLPNTGYFEHNIDAVKLEYYRCTHKTVHESSENKYTHKIVNNKNFLDTYEMDFDTWCSKINDELLKYDLDLESLKKLDIFLNVELKKFFENGKDPEYTAKKFVAWYKKGKSNGIG